MAYIKNTETSTQIEFAAVVVCQNYMSVLDGKFVPVVSCETVTNKPKALIVGGKSVLKKLFCRPRVYFLFRFFSTLLFFFFTSSCC